MDNPLEGRVCIQLLVAGIRIPDDDDPVCMGRRCSNYEICLSSLIEARHSIDRHEKHPAHKRISAGKPWDDLTTTRISLRRDK